MKKFWLVALLAILFANHARAKLFELSEFVLPNGLRVIVAPNHKAPVVKHMVWYKSGSIDEEPGKGGTAHLLEHLMFRGTKNISGADFNSIMQKNGAESNAFTSHNFTVYHQFADISRLELLMYLEADRMSNLTVADDDFVTERDIVFQERQQMVKTNPLANFLETMRRNLWQTHPFANPITGTEREIMNLKPEDVRNYYESFYAPNNAVLVIAGDIEPKTAHRLALKYYGGIAPKELAIPNFPLPENKAVSTLKMSIPMIQIPRLVRLYTAPANSYPCMVLAEYLGGSETSELYRTLVINKKAAISAGASYNYISRSLGNFDVVAVPRNGIKIEQLKMELDVAMEQAINSLTVEKLEKIKNKMLAGLVYLNDNPADAAYIIGSLATMGLSVEEIESYADNIKAITLEDIKQAADNILHNQSVIEGMTEIVK